MEFLSSRKNGHCIFFGLRLGVIIVRVDDEHYKDDFDFSTLQRQCSDERYYFLYMLLQRDHLFEEFVYSE